MIIEQYYIIILNKTFFKKDIRRNQYADDRLFRFLNQFQHHIYKRYISLCILPRRNTILTLFRLSK